MGDVIVHDEKPRMQWKLALVEGLIKGRDDLVRAAHIKMGNYRTTRPIVKLYPLEVCNPDAVNPPGHSDSVTNETRNSQSTIDEKRVDSNSSVGQRARRKAASKALEKISEWTSTLSRAPEDVVND